MSAAGGRVIIADDDVEIRGLLGEYLRRNGWEVVEAANGLEALLQVKRQQPQAVLLDLCMPRLGGIETLKRIHAFDPAIAVVIVSGNLDGEVRREAERLGVATLLDKPVALPLVLAALGASERQMTTRTASAPPPTVGTRPAGTRRILVVDDDADIRAMLEEFLASKGYRVRSAADGAAAIRDLVTVSADVILLDIDMPRLSGTDALPTLRAVAPRAVTIMVSGTTNEQIARRTLAAGAFDYITKPLDLAHLIDTIETAVAMQGAL